MFADHVYPKYKTRDSLAHYGLHERLRVVANAQEVKYPKLVPRCANAQQKGLGSVINYWEQDAEGNIRKNPFQDREFLERMKGAMLDKDFDPGKPPSSYGSGGHIRGRGRGGRGDI